MLTSKTKTCNLVWYTNDAKSTIHKYVYRWIAKKNDNMWPIGPWNLLSIVVLPVLHGVCKK